MTSRETMHKVHMKGGSWLGVTREELQTRTNLGRNFLWGTDHPVKGLTIRDIEEIAAAAVAADRNLRNLK